MMKFKAIVVVFALGVTFAAQAKADPVDGFIYSAGGNTGFFEAGILGQRATGFWQFNDGYSLVFVSEKATEKTNTYITDDPGFDGDLLYSTFNYEPGGILEIFGPDGFAMLGTLTSPPTSNSPGSVSFFSVEALDGPVGSVVVKQFYSDFTGTANDGSTWAGVFNLDERFQCCEQDISVLGFQELTGPTVSIPEPGGWVLLSAGFASLFGMVWRRRGTPWKRKTSD